VNAARRALGVTLAALLLGACASPPPLESGWTSGRLSVRVDAAAAGKPQSFVAAFELRGSGERGELRLLSPLGVQFALARWSHDEAALTTAEGERRYASLDDLSLDALGERLPLAALPDWVAGRPWGGAPSRPSGAGFEQLGWAVDLSRHAEGQLAARREAAPVVTMRIQLDPPAS
jgi:outer membrane lipoprotein LolB